MKKSILLFIALLTGFVFTQQLQAQTHTSEEIVKAGTSAEQYAFITANANFMQGAIMTGAKLIEQNKDTAFEIVLLGKVLKDISTDRDLFNFIENNGSEAGVRITICESALNKLKLDKADFPKNVHFTPNAFIYYYGLQALGYNGIDL